MQGQAQEGIWNWGIRTQGIWDFAPGQDLYPGIELGYSNFYLAKHKLQFKAAYLTSRLEEVVGRHIPRQDYFLLGTAWHFRRKNIFDPYVQLDLGYNRFDTEGLDIKNSAYIFSTVAGLNINLQQGQYGFYYDVGLSYTPLFMRTSTLYPGIFNFGFWVNL